MDLEETHQEQQVEKEEVGKRVGSDVSETPDKAKKRSKQPLTDAQRKEILRKRRLARLKQRGDAFLRNPENYSSPSKAPLPRVQSSEKKSAEENGGGGGEQGTTKRQSYSSALILEDTISNPPTTPRLDERGSPRVLRLNDGPAKSPDVVGMIAHDEQIITRDMVSPTVQEIERKHSALSTPSSFDARTTPVASDRDGRRLRAASKPSATDTELDKRSARMAVTSQWMRQYVRMFVVAAVSSLLALLHHTCHRQEFAVKDDSDTAAHFMCEISTTVHPLVFFLTLQLVFHLPGVLFGVQRWITGMGTSRGASTFDSSTNTVIDTLLELTKIFSIIKTIAKHLCVFIIAYIITSQILGELAMRTSIMHRDIDSRIN